MPPERRPPDDPREWINRARSNLVRAQTTLPGVYLEDLCFDAQQAAEKAIKAVLNLPHGLCHHHRNLAYLPALSVGVFSV
jgi:HEPN domain-containing protein